MTTTTPPTENNESQVGRSLLFGITVWFVHLNVVYALASVACRWSLLSFTVMGISGLQLVETIISLVTLPFMLFLIYQPWRAWRGFQTATPPANPRFLEDTEMDRRALAAFIVMLLNSSFCLFVVAWFVPIFALRPCVQS
jgi:hypothetical protein